MGRRGEEKLIISFCSRCNKSHGKFMK